MQLISPEYMRQNQLLHLKQSKYGISAQRYFNDIDAWLPDLNLICSAIDYGCGKGLLREHLQFPVYEYDPAIPGKDRVPPPADIVFCIDVLEHVEPKYTDNVLEHIRLLAIKGVYITVALKAGKRRLPDGRLAHINVQPVDFWERKFDWFFRRWMCVHDTQVSDKEMIFKGLFKK